MFLLRVRAIRFTSSSGDDLFNQCFLYNKGRSYRATFSQFFFFFFQEKQEKQENQEKQVQYQVTFFQILEI